MFVLGVRMSHDNCISVNDVVFMTLIYARLHSAPTCKCPQQDTAVALKEPLAIGEGKGSMKNRGGEQKEEQKMGWTSGSCMRNAAQGLVAGGRARLKTI